MLTLFTSLRAKRRRQIIDGASGLVDQQGGLPKPSHQTASGPFFLLPPLRPLPSSLERPKPGYTVRCMSRWLQGHNDLMRRHWAEPWPRAL